jgi:hypothetical protein
MFSAAFPYQKEPSSANRDALREFIGLDGTKLQRLYGVANPRLVESESYWFDTALLQPPGNAEIQLDLFLGYARNVIVRAGKF